MDLKPECQVTFKNWKSKNLVITICIDSINIIHCDECCSARQVIKGIFTARCYASTASVCPSIRQSQVGVLLKWLNTGSRKQQNMIAQDSIFWSQRSWQNSNAVIQNGDAKYRWV